MKRTTSTRLMRKTTIMIRIIHVRISFKLVPNV